MIFPNLQLEPIVQVNDRTRLDASKSFVTADESAISSIEVMAASGGDFIDVTTNQYLDWQYSASGVQTVTCRVTAGAASAQVTASISVVTADSENLFSSDQELKTHEPDILKWVEDGRNSFINIHRKVQTLIMDHLRNEGYVDVNGDPYTQAAVTDVAEVRQWSSRWVLQLIFAGLSNAVDDIFQQKSDDYSLQRQKWESTALLRIDTDGDGVTDNNEGIDTLSTFVGRR